MLGAPPESRSNANGNRSVETTQTRYDTLGRPRGHRVVSSKVRTAPREGVTRIREFWSGPREFAAVFREICIIPREFCGMLRKPRGAGVWRMAIHSARSPGIGHTVGLEAAPPPAAGRSECRFTEGHAMTRTTWSRISAVLVLLILLTPAVFAAPRQAKRELPELRAISCESPRFSVKP